MEKTANRSVLKSLDFLEYFIPYQDLSLADLVDLSGMPKSTVHRIVHTLEMRGFLSRTVEQGQPRYQLGLKLLELGNLVAQRLEIRKIALPYMRKLCERVDEAVNLIVRDQDEAIYIEKVDAPHYVRMYTQTGRRSPLYAGACPRILLTYMDDEEIEALFNRIQFKKITPDTPVDKTLLWKWIRQARKRGYTLSYGELEADSAALGVPIRDYSGRVIAGLSLAGATSRFQGERLEMLIRETKKTASEIMKRLGYDEAREGYGEAKDT